MMIRKKANSIMSLNALKYITGQLYENRTLTRHSLIQSLKIPVKLSMCESNRKTFFVMCELKICYPDIINT